MVLVGDSNVGKTAIFTQLTTQQYIQTHAPTIGVDFKFKEVNLDNRQLKLQIWDTAGQEKYRSICNIYYKGADIILLIFDLCNRVI